MRRCSVVRVVALCIAALPQVATGNEPRAGGLKLASKRVATYERPDESFRDVFLQAVAQEDADLEGVVRTPRKPKKIAAKAVDATKLPAGKKLGALQEAASTDMDDSFKEAFLDAVENDEETNALAEEMNTRYARRGAQYIIKGTSAARSP
mmetsp:Transcript_118930/g.333098  ORF Transcript_118930/g.333098 Transcript_118930/m.333098 type:complete len:151 (-) Transcript_118930:78-530(-)